MDENIVRLDIVMALNARYVELVTLKGKQKLLQKNDYLFLRAYRKDWIERNIKKIPVSNIINFDKSAQNKFKKLPDKIVLNMSKPLRAIKRPKNTTICIINFFLLENITANIEKKRIGMPIIEGIRDVNDELAVTKLTNRPHNIRNMP